MINTAESDHLNEAELVKAVVDRADLDRQRLRHLADCRQCRSQIEVLAGDLNKAARLAADSSPAVTRPFRAPAADARHTGWLPIGRKLTAGLAVAAALIIVGGLYWQNQQNSRSRQMALEMREAEQLMRQVSLLVENPLPRAVMTISAEGVVENDADFLRFLIPEESGDAALSQIGVENTSVRLRLILQPGSEHPACKA